MRLSCRKCFLLVLALALGPACRDATAPRLLAFYFLESINSQPLPGSIQQAGTTITVVTSTLSLDVAGNAVFTDHVRLAPGNSTPVETITTRYSYRILGDSIAFDYQPPCPPNALCVAPPGAKISDSKLTVMHSGFPPFRPPFTYRLAGPD